VVIKRGSANNPAFKLVEKDHAVAFFRAARDYFGSQVAVANKTGLAQPTVNGILAKKDGVGHKSLLAISQATGISIEDILSGSGAVKLRSRSGPAVDGKNSLNRLKATRALVELFDVTQDEVEAIFDELGTSLTSEVAPEIWFDTGRAAIERRRRGLPLTRAL
jgi:transcriptional regulator with XRE-family HTH domain